MMEEGGLPDTWPCLHGGRSLLYIDLEEISEGRQPRSGKVMARSGL